MSLPTAHEDTFARDHLPAPEAWPDFLFELPELQYPDRLNAAAELLDRHIRSDDGNRAALIFEDRQWSYAQLADKASQIANVLVRDMGLVPGNRVLLRGFNNPMMVAAWFAVLKAGGIAVATMPMLRARDLDPIVEKAQISHALCDERLADDLEKVAASRDCLAERGYFTALGDGGTPFDKLVARRSKKFDPLPTLSDDVALIAFTSGTTGKPKGTVHFHRDIMSMCHCVGRGLLGLKAEDRVIGSPPIAFTFGLGALVTFPLQAGAASILLENGTPPNLARAIEQYRATWCFTAPTAYRAILGEIGGVDLSSLKNCVSAGEHLPLPVFEDWKKATGISLINGLGSTEMIHIFISAAGKEIRPGATGKAIRGYEARVVDERMQDVPVGETGKLAVRGPTGCRYLEDERQKVYVRDGWNLTGDAYRMDQDGYFWFMARTDDLIVSSGYNISGPEVEEVLLSHPAVRECAVVGVPDDKRGQIVKAFVVPAEPYQGCSKLVLALQDHVKEHIAPYKYPREVAFLDSLPKTETGKIQRFKLKEL
ncbi:AMP-binding protein [Emcibacter nanhaiensis]|uniref:AMP-binding protein n=1 Tax=Emcibacter nanhaiensis TaxID=1505037 RepID=A0A501PFL4_9PROT|nr:AMP-binding protein [Emcibacter nanhaiensis]TPD59213.1 AMP-binding protein [Emcibacter nanhaiensis]